MSTPVGPFCVSSSREKLLFRPQTKAELWGVVEEAFHFRGDVTLRLRSGECVVGYLFNRNVTVDSPNLHMYVKGQSCPRRILYSEVIEIHFSGEDTASGKDWEAWVKKKSSEREAEALHVEEGARARGHL